MINEMINDLKNDILRENGECDLYDICQSLISTYICSTQAGRRRKNKKNQNYDKRNI